MGAVLSLQGDRKVVIYGDESVESSTTYGSSKIFAQSNGHHHHHHHHSHNHNHHHHNTSRSFFGQATKENSKHFKFGHALFGDHNMSTKNFPQHNHPPLAEMHIGSNGEPIANQNYHPTSHHHGLGLKKSLGFINALHLGKHFGWGKEKKNKVNKHDLSGQQSLNNSKMTQRMDAGNDSNTSSTGRNCIQKSLSCYNLKSGTTTTNIEIVKNINKNINAVSHESDDSLNNNNNNNNICADNNSSSNGSNNVVRINSIQMKKNSIESNISRHESLIVPKKEDSFLYGGRKPVVLTTEQFPVVNANDCQSKPIIFLSKSSQVRPNVYNVLQQAYTNGVNGQIKLSNSQSSSLVGGGNNPAVCTRKTSSVSLGSNGSSSIIEGPNHLGQKRTVIQVCESERHSFLLRVMFLWTVYRS